MTSEAPQHAGHLAPVLSPSVINHVMHASYGEVRVANTTAMSIISVIYAFIC